VSKDLPLRIKAAAVGLEAEEYRAELAVESGWTGMAELEVCTADLDLLYVDGALDLDEARELPCSTGLVLVSDRGSALGRVRADKRVHLVRGDREVFGIHGRSAEQRVALELLLDPDVGIVSLGGRAGTGKSAMALCAGLEAVLERGRHKKVVVFRRCSRSAARSSATCRATSRRRCRRGARRSSTPWAPHLLRRGRRDPRPRHAGGPPADPHPRGVPCTTRS
jgi:PhoH-like ATPase